MRNALMATLTAAVVVALLAGPAASQQAADLVNDYPTEARADYVFGCMAVNGRDRETLRRCSCAIDVVASILPYDRYVAAETVISLRQTTGERIGMMRTAPMASEAVRDLRRAQAEGDIRCF
jgi:hypothetical protein